MDRAETWITQFMQDGRVRREEAWADANESRLGRVWPADIRPRDLAGAWRTGGMDAPVRGPDRMRVAIWVRSGGQDLPFRDLPGNQPRQDGYVYAVCVQRLPVGPVRQFCTFTAETSARWYAIELARAVQQAGFTGLRPQDIFLERPRRTPGTSWRPGTPA